jgi:hypothetical protein
MVEQVALDPYYYRDNFLRLCATVEDQYGDLLESREMDFLRRFLDLDHDAQCLYVRLVSRVGPYFRLSRLDYPEIGDLDAGVRALAAADLVVFAAELDIATLGQLFTVAQLRSAFPELPALRGKTALLAAIGLLPLTPAELLSQLTTPAEERVLAPTQVETVRLLHLLFFGNRRQGLTDFVLSDLGLARYYPYRLDRRHRLFPSREALDEYLRYADLSDRFVELREGGECRELALLAGEMLSFRPVYPSSEGRWNRLCNSVARELERQGEHELALTLYRRSERHPARERCARIMETREDWSGALEICRQITIEPFCEAERDAARRMMPRLERKLSATGMPRRRDHFPTETMTLPRTGLAVERAAADRLREDWTAVHYVENALMNGLFGLAFWEQIFAPVAGVFHNPYQSVPADMYDPEFRRRRQRQLEGRLIELAGCDLQVELATAWRRYTPYQCRWVNWRLLDERLIGQTLAAVPPDHLLAIWQRILFDPGENRRGFPDLIALGERCGQYRMIEVKGPGDTLQDSQKRWLRFFIERGIEASVLKVAWQHD